MNKELKLITKTETNGNRVQLTFAEDIQQVPGQQPIAKTAVTVILSDNDIYLANDLKSGETYNISINKP